MSLQPKQEERLIIRSIIKLVFREFIERAEMIDTITTISRSVIVSVIIVVQTAPTIEISRCWRIDRKKSAKMGREQRREDFAPQALPAASPSFLSEDGHFLRSQSAIIGYCEELFSPVPHGNRPMPLESFSCLLASHLADPNPLFRVLKGCCRVQEDSIGEIELDGKYNLSHLKQMHRNVTFSKEWILTLTWEQLQMLIYVSILTLFGISKVPTLTRIVNKEKGRSS